MMAVTPSDIEMVQRTWVPVATDLEGNGTFIFKTYLDRYNYYNNFEKFRDLPREDLLYNPVFRSHSLKIMKNLNDMVNNLGDEAKLQQIFTSIGKIHNRKKVEYHQFQELQGVIIELLQGGFKITLEESKAWGRVLTRAFTIISERLAVQ